jgi:hypothetical protein
MDVDSLLDRIQEEEARRNGGSTDLHSRLKRQSLGTPCRPTILHNGPVVQRCVKCAKAIIAEGLPGYAEADDFAVLIGYVQAEFRQRRSTRFA